MNDATSTPATDAAQLSVDAEHPWLGLASFTEETRAYFYGREEEVTELARRVQRKLLTVLFGQSGLGKTSILRAGIVPRLRPEGYCPVYVRLDYSPESPLPSEQIKQAIFRATESSGKWTQVGVAESGESLWEFLHHRDDILRDETGRTLIPLLIFDQFEELFTLAQSDEFGRQRAAQFVEDLADLVENRAPKALEAKMDQDESAVERFDFTRGDYRILIALREDYLAHLEGLKGNMPSIAQNRMRLARMTGAQALAAVLKPGGRLVSDEVAGSIVRFVAGGAELANAEVEPALLSLICRELNNARIAQGRSEISADLLAGSRDNILTEFYERALADQPHRVRQFIEDNLLTESGHRESLAEERMQKGLATAGASPDTLAVLVNRRLLRIEERLDVRRVELTHDVLCSVVKASRDLRLEREARDEAERKLAAQRERERATRKALVRARQIAAGCAVLAIFAAAAAVFGYMSMTRAQQAEAKAEETRLLAEAARGEAEKLIVFLLDDFYLELEPVGRLDIVAQLAKRSLDYYRELPTQLRTPETERNRALALVRYGSVLRYQSNLDEGEKVLTEAVGILDGLRAKGDTSEITAAGLALGLTAQARILDSRSKEDDARGYSQRAAAILTPLMATPAPSVPLRRAYASVMNYFGFAQLRSRRQDLAVDTLEKSRAAFRSIAGEDFADLPAAAGYVEASAWQAETLRDLGRSEEALRVSEEGVAVAGRILDKRPAHMGALRARGLIRGDMADIGVENMQLRKGLVAGDDAVRDWEAFVKLDSGNVIAWNNLAASQMRNANLLYGLGRLDEARDRMLAANSVERRAKMSSFLALNLSFPAAQRTALEADRGNVAEAEAAFADFHRLVGIVAAASSMGPTEQAILRGYETGFKVTLPVAAGDYVTARKMLQASMPGAGVVAPAEGTWKFYWDVGLAIRYRALADANYNLQDYAEAERAVRQAIAYQTRLPEQTLERKRDAAQNQVLLALILTRLDRRPEAQQAVAPALKLHRELQARNGDDLALRIELARTLYAAALAGNVKETALLAEAAAQIDGLPSSLRNLKSARLIRGDIAEEQGSRRK
jgi:hypothetical protein